MGSVFLFLRPAISTKIKRAYKSYQQVEAELDLAHIKLGWASIQWIALTETYKSEADSWVLDEWMQTFNKTWHSWINHKLILAFSSPITDVNLLCECYG